MPLSSRKFRLEAERRLTRGANRGSMVLPGRLHGIFQSEAELTCPFKGRWGTRQYAHPDLINYPGGLAMAATAYPFGAEVYEVPEVFVSGTEGDWVPHLSVSPLRAEARSHHYSDPDLFSGPDGLILYYRKCPRDRHVARVAGGPKDRLYALAKGEGEARLVLEGPYTSLLSPSVFSWGGKTMLLCVDDSAGESRLRRFEASDPWSFTEMAGAELPGFKAWHLDIAVIKGRLLGIFLVLTDDSQHVTKLILAGSEDGAATWNYLCDMAFDAPGINRTYRSSICETEDGAVIALGYETMWGAWGIELRRLEEDGEGYRIGEKVDRGQKAFLPCK